MSINLRTTFPTTPFLLTSLPSSGDCWWSLWPRRRSRQRCRPRSPRWRRWRWTESRCRCRPWRVTDRWPWERVAEWSHKMLALPQIYVYAVHLLIYWDRLILSILNLNSVGHLCSFFFPPEGQILLAYWSSYSFRWPIHIHVLLEYHCDRLSTILTQNDWWNCSANMSWKEHYSAVAGVSKRNGIFSIF